MKRRTLVACVGLTGLFLAGCGGGAGSAGLEAQGDTSRTVSVGIEVTPTLAPPSIIVMPNCVTSTTATCPLVVAVMPTGYNFDAPGYDDGTSSDFNSADGEAGSSRGWFSWYYSTPRTTVSAPKRIWVTYSELFQPDSLPGSLSGHLLQAVKKAAFGWNAPKMALAETDEQLPLPQRDQQWTAQWANFTGAGQDAVGAAFIWLDGRNIIEADLAFNLKYNWTKSAGQNETNRRWFRREVERIVGAMIADGKLAALDAAADNDTEIVAGDGTSIAAPSSSKRRWRWLSWRASR